MDGELKEWGSSLQALQELGDALEGGDPELVKGCRECHERLRKVVKKLGEKALELLQFGPIKQVVVSIERACRGAVAAVQGGGVDALQQVKCRVLLGKSFDLMEVMIEGVMKRQETGVKEIFTSILAKTKQPEKIDKLLNWWMTALGGRCVVTYDEFFEEYAAVYLKDMPHDSGLKEAIKACVDYTNDNTVSIYEFAFYCLWLHPSPDSPKALILLLKQGCFQYQYDRKCYSLALKTPGDYFIRTTVNQGGGWCVSFVDSYLKARHVLLTMLPSGWAFPNSTTKEQNSSTSILGLLLKNSDILQIPKGVSFDVPHVEWDETHAAGDDDV
eukprot:TRINITY_DN6340_c0_g1_i2.p1 TRINITY_DN6340_c0_g1~~TRINITY_DN6340_c0_g1_i2.p1  ORF type:complete len:339 (+),score=121.81 TRINITY_DN6340_c0_g1_i2:32-1018(+)